MKPPVRAIVALVALLTLVLAAVFVSKRGRSPNGALEASGTVEATEADLGFTVPGRIDSVFVQEGDTVGPGAELARLDRAETAARREQAAAQAGAARAALQELERGARPEELAQARSAAKAAEDQLADAQSDHDRMKRLRVTSAVSEQQYEKAATALEVARSRRDQVRDALRLVQLGPRHERIAAARATLAAAEASVRTLDATLANMTVRAPFAGVVTVRHHEPGEIVGAGAAVVTLLDRDDRWVRIYVPETRLGAVHVGQAATLTSDTFRGRRYPGRVSTIASEAEFTPKTVQTREERVKLVYAVKVRIAGDPAFELKPGLPVDVVLEAAR